MQPDGDDDDSHPDDDNDDDKDKWAKSMTPHQNVDHLRAKMCACLLKLEMDMNWR